MRAPPEKILQRLRTDSTTPASETTITPSTQDPLTLGRRNRDAERKKRDAKRRAAAATAAAAMARINEDGMVKGCRLSPFFCRTII